MLRLNRDIVKNKDDLKELGFNKMVDNSFWIKETEEYSILICNFIDDYYKIDQVYIEVKQNTLILIDFEFLYKMIKEKIFIYE